MKATSLEAYQTIKPKIKTDHDKILNTMSKTKAYTYNEIAWMIGWFNPNKVSRRMPELVRLGKVKIDAIRKCSRAKSNCQTYLLA